MAAAVLLAERERDVTWSSGPAPSLAVLLPTGAVGRWLWAHRPVPT
ncbi:hypothetical protein J5Y04_13665 [Kitasatospora sp. RG8]|nr:hypothetical protein [Kitasatospora sp. RG8]MBP0450584.1 hypothetical protein [Kitasatospora sp. RG8]